MKIFVLSSEGFSDLFWATAWVNARARSAKTAIKQCLMVNPFLGDEILFCRMIDRTNCSFTHAVRQVMESSSSAGLERLQGAARTGAACIVVRSIPGHLIALRFDPFGDLGPRYASFIAVGGCEKLHLEILMHRPRAPGDLPLPDISVLAFPYRVERNQNVECEVSAAAAYISSFHSRGRVAPHAPADVGVEVAGFPLPNQVNAFGKLADAFRPRARGKPDAAWQGALTFDAPIGMFLFNTAYCTHDFHTPSLFLTSIIGAGFNYKSRSMGNLIEREEIRSHKRESGASSPTFLFASQFHKSRDKHPHAGRQYHGGQRRLSQIPLLFFESFLYQPACVCSAITVSVTDQACARHPHAGDGATRYCLIRCRSGQQLN